MSGAAPDHRVRVPLSHQRWADATFLHWRYQPAQLRPLVPAGLELQVLDGSAWLSLTPFTLAALRVPGLPPVPRWSTFPEVNLRTYVSDGEHDGVLFLRIRCGRRLVTAGFRYGLGLPYVYRRGSVRLEDERVEYRVRGTQADVAVGARVAPSGLEHALTGRWNAYSVHAGRLLRVPIEHPTWPLHEARVTGFRTDIWDGLDLRPPEAEPWVHFSPGVDVRVGAPRVLDRSARPRT